MNFTYGPINSPSKEQVIRSYEQQLFAAQQEMLRASRGIVTLTCNMGGAAQSATGEFTRCWSASVI